MGIDPVTIGAIGMGLGGIGQLWGAHNQNQSNQANLAAQQQARQQLFGMVSPYMTAPGTTNPYVNSLAQFFGGTPGAVGTPALGAASVPQTGLLGPGAAGPQWLNTLQLDPDAGGETQFPTMGNPGNPQGPGGGGPTGAPGGAGQGNGIGSGAWRPPTGGAGFTAPSFGAMWQFQNPGAATFNPSQAATPTGTQAFNVGQDALMQAARAQLGPADIPGLMNGLANAASGNTQFDNSQLFKSLGALDRQLLNEQVGELHGSAGSLGQRFGTAMMQNEAMLRGNFANQASARNAQIAQQSFEAAQGRAMQGLGMMQGQQQFLSQHPLAALAAQMQAGQALSQIGLGQQELGANVNLQNAGFMNQAGQFNAGQQQNMNQFAAQQGNIYNNLALQGMGMANQFQQQQFGNNAQLLGLLAGIPVAPAQAPSAWPGAIAEVGQTAAMWPFLAGMYPRRPGAQQVPWDWAG